MPTIKTRFSLKSEDVERLKQAIANCGTSSEESINDYLHNQAGDLIAKSITQFIPRSNRDKVHAKDSKWHEQANYNLAVGISNSLKGKRDRSFYYLYYVATGTGTSEKRGKNDFMERGMNQEYNNIVNQLITRLTQNIDKELK